MITLTVTIDKTNKIVWTDAPKGRFICHGVNPESTRKVKAYAHIRKELLISKGNEVVIMTKTIPEEPQQEVKQENKIEYVVAFACIVGVILTCIIAILLK